MSALYETGSQMSFEKPYQLFYFNLFGYSSKLRFALYDCNVPFIDKKIIFDIWNEKEKRKTAFSQLPLFITPSGESIIQSNSILRYIGRRFDCYGTNLEFTDQIIDAVQDWENSYYKLIKADLSSKVFKYFLEDTKKLDEFVIENYNCGQMNAFNKLKNNISAPFFGGEKPSIGDYYLFDLLFKIKKISAEHYEKNFLPEKFKHLKEWYSKLRNRPNVKRHLNNWTSNFLKNNEKC